MQKRFPTRLWQRVLVALVVMLAGSWCPALETVQVGAGFDRQVLGPHMEYLEDPGRKFELADVLARPSAFSPSDQRILNPGYTPSGYWVRFRVHNTASEPIQLFLEYSSRFADHLNLYQPNVSGGYSVTRSGRKVRPSQRPHPSRDFVFPVKLPSDSTQTFYLYADSADTLTIPLFLHDDDSLNETRLTKYSWFAFYQGLVFAMSVFSLFMLITLRNSIYFFYMLVIVLHHGLFFALFDGFGYALFGFEDPYWSREAISVLLCISLAAINQFCRELLSTRQQMPQLDRIIQGLVAFSLITAVFSVFIDYYISIRIGNPIASTTALVMWIVGWNGYRRGVPAARYFLFAWTCVIIGGLAYSLKSWGIAPSNLLTEFGWQIGSAIEALLLSMAIAERVRVEMREREISQEKARQAQEHALEVQRRSNEMLEQSVLERTEELEAANRKLERMSLTDDLTELPNKRYLQDKLETETQRAEREQQPLAVMMLDIDHFKEINDTHGHLAGDDCLREAARVLQQALNRTTDFVVRYGGEEFCILLVNTDLQGAAEVGERLRNAVEMLQFSIDGEPVPVTISVGVTAEIPSGKITGERLIQLADDALYQAKRKGRNCLVQASFG